MSRSTCVRLSNEGRVGAFNGESSISSMYTHLRMHFALLITFAIGLMGSEFNFTANLGFYLAI